MYTTRPRPFDMEERYPALTAFRRVATRLHPRPGEPGVRDSSVGGPPLWPADEPWPTCAVDHSKERSHGVSAVRRRRELSFRIDEARDRGGDVTSLTGELAELRDEERRTVAATVGPQPLIAVAQVFAADVPDLPRPDGTDVLQMLWCPYDHPEEGHLPSIRLVWRDSRSVVDVAEDLGSASVTGHDGYVPQPCVVHAERVVEYPLAWCAGVTLPDELIGFDDKWSIVDGWKIGGWGGYCGFCDPEIPACGCGAPTVPLLTVGNGEWSTYDGQWRPVEDEDFVPTARHPIDWDPVRTLVGRAYMMQVFTCSTGFDCPPTARMT